MYCTRCGNALTEGAAFCRRCGHAVGTSTSAVTGDATEAIPSFSEPPAVAPETFAPPAATIPSSAFMPYAGFWLRLVAYFIDAAILWIAFGAIIGIVIAFVGWDRIRHTRPGLEVQLTHFDVLSVALQREFNYRQQLNFPGPAIFGAILSAALAITIVTWFYYALMESSATQGTLGKMALGLIVTDLYGRRISFARASGRFFGKFITGLIPLFIGYLMIAFAEKKQALHDILAGSWF